MAHRQRTAALVSALVGIALLGAPTALAQPETQPESEIISHDQVGSALNITFPGGTMAEFVDALKESIPGPFNVQLRREAPALEVLPMDLKWVSIGTAFELAIPQYGQWNEIQPDGSQIMYYRDLKIIGGDDRHSTPVYIIDAFTRKDQRNPFQGVKAGYTQSLEVYSVERAVKSDADVQKLLTAIDTALELSDAGQAAEVKYHPDTSLLIVRGAPEQVKTIEQVIDRFGDTSNARENERIAQAIRMTELRTELIERRADMERAEADMYMSVKELEELKAMADKEDVSNRQVIEGETSLRIAETEMRTAKARYEAAQEKMKLFASSVTRAQTETRTYELGHTNASRTLTIKIFEELDDVSGHIKKVRGVRNDRGELVASVEADEEGHRALGVLVRAIQHGDQWTSGAPSRNADRDTSWGWVREYWGQDFYDSLVP